MCSMAGCDRLHLVGAHAAGTPWKGDEGVGRWVERMSPFIWGAACVLMALQIALTFFLIDPGGIEWIRYLGYAIWAAACVFGWLPMYTLRKRGGVRHPQYLGFILLSLALILIAQDWMVTVIGVLAMAFSYLITVNADCVNLEKFGDDYRRYMEAVPRTNFLLGIIRQSGREKEDDS